MKFVYYFLPIITTILVVYIIWYTQFSNKFDGVIKVGLFHDQDIIDAELLAIDEINNAGGLLGKKIVPISLEAKSNESDFAIEAERLIKQEHVVALFGCMTSSCRAILKPIAEKENSLLFFVGPFERLGESPSIVYTGASPNQQVIPAVTWCLRNIGTRIFVVGAKLTGADAVSQAMVYEIIKDVIFAYNGHLVGEAYVSSDKAGAEKAAKQIIATQPNAIINLLRGEANHTFYKTLRDEGISSEKIPSMSLNITELELARYHLDEMIGDYATQNYFQSLATPANTSFVRNFKEKYGAHRSISNPMENAYAGVYFWKNAAIIAQSTDANAVRAHLGDQGFSAPEGIISIDKKTLHTWKPVLVGKIFPNRQFGIVWNSVSTIRPLNDEPLRTKEEWDEILHHWRKEFGGR